MHCSERDEQQQGRWLGKRLLLCVKILVTLIFCLLIYRNIDWPAAWQAMSTVRPATLLLVFAGMLANVAVSTWKWKILLAMHSIDYPFFALYRYYLIGSFFNNFLPSTIGGDGYRIYKTVNNPVSKSGAVSAVFMERLTGLLALLITGWLGGCVASVSTGNILARQMMIWGSVLLVLLLVGILAAGRIPSGLITGIRAKIPEKIVAALVCLQDYRRAPGSVAAVLLLSIVFQVFLLVLYMVLFHEVAGRPVSIAALAVAVCLSTLMSLLPVSINGIGLLDGSFIYVLSTFHVAYENGLIVMLLIRLLTYLQSLVGGIFYFFEKKSRRGSEARRDA